MTKRKIPPTRFPDAVAVAYQRKLLELVRQMHRTTLKEFDKAIKPQIQSYQADVNELTAIQRLLDLIKAMALNIFNDATIIDIANTFVTGLNLFNMKNMNDQAKVAGVNPIGYEDWIDDYVQSSVQQNIKYIRSIPEKYHSSVETLVYEGMKSGTSTKEMREQIVKQFHVSESKAQFIAIDQSGTIHGQLVAKRHQNMGVNKFEWVTSGDERVRMSHRALSGKVYNYKSPPNGKVPGQDYRCRCTAYPVFSDEVKTYKEFNNTDEVEKFFDTKNFLNSLSQDEKNAITKYTTDYYEELNGYLRNKGKDKTFNENKQVEEIAKNISYALNKSVINDNIRLFRTVEDNNFIEKLKAGNKFTDYGFVSATPIYDFDINEYVLHLEIPKGTKAAYIDPISAYEGEEEVILDRNTTFKITKILDDHNILCEVVDRMKKDSKELSNKQSLAATNENLRTDSKHATKRRKDRFSWNEKDVEFTKNNNN